MQPPVDILCSCQSSVTQLAATQFSQLICPDHGSGFEFYYPSMTDPNEPNWKSFAPITAYDKAGYVWISVLYGMTFSLLILAIILWYKQAAFGRYDSFFIAASVSLDVQTICIQSTYALIESWR